MPSEWVTLARVVRPQGRKGEVLADLLTDFPEQFGDGTEVFLHHGTDEPRPVDVESWWLPTGRSAGRVVLKLAGANSITDAEALIGAMIQSPSSQRLTLEDGIYYVSDLVGCRMVHRGDVIGTVTDMHFPQDPTGRRIADAASIFVVERFDGDEVLIPFASAFVRRIDLGEKVIEMNLPDGLLEMNG